MSITTLIKNNITSLVQSIKHQYTLQRHKNGTLYALGVNEHFLLRKGKGPIDLVLLPSLYWIKKASLPVRKSNEAQTLAPSLYDGFLPVDEEYNYLAFPAEDDKFLLLAFSKVRIRQAIKEMGIDPKRVREIFFAQNLFASLAAPLNIGNDRSILVDKGIVLYLPSSYVEKSYRCRNEHLDHYFSSKGYPHHFFEDNHLDTKTLRTTYIVSTAIIIVLLGQTALLKKSFQELQEQKSIIETTENLPSTTLVTQSIEAKLLKQQYRQYKLRENIRYLQSFPFQHGVSATKKNLETNSTVNDEIPLHERIESIVVRDEHIDIVFILHNAKRAEEVRNYLSKRFKIDSITAKGTRISVKALLW